MDQAFPALSKSLNSSIALQGLSFSPKELRLLDLANINSKSYYESLSKCSDRAVPAAKTKCVLEAISRSSKCKTEYHDLLVCAKKLALSGPADVRQNLQTCRKPERELAQCVDWMVSDLLDSLAGKTPEFVVFERLEKIDNLD